MSFSESVRAEMPEAKTDASMSPLKAHDSAVLPRLLFISVNPFSDTSNNGKTFASFFQGYPKAKLAQLYFHRERPSSGVCDNYYHVTDEEILKHPFQPRKVVGRQVLNESELRSSIPEVAHSRLKRSWTARFIRQILWRRVSLNGGPLAEWLDSFRPEVIVFCGGDAVSLYPKVHDICSRTGARLVLYVTDDYVLPLKSHNLAAQLIRRWTRRAFVRAASRADLTLTIGQAMSDVYRRDFGIESTPMMNMVHVPRSVPAARDRMGSEPFTLLYAGSLHSNRWKVIQQIGKSLDRLSEQGIRARLLVCGPELDQQTRGAIESCSSVLYGGMLDPQQLRRALTDSDALLHVESDDPTSMAVTTLSVSTKIPEYLASGRCIVAAGPDCLASIRYLADNDAAIIVRPGDEIQCDDKLQMLIQNPDLCGQYAARGFDLAKKNHDGARTRIELWERLSRLNDSQAYDA